MNLSRALQLSMFWTAPQKAFLCSIQGDYPKAKDDNMVLNCSPQVVWPPLNSPRIALLDWYYRRSVRGNQGLWTLSTSAGGEQLSVGFQSWHFMLRLGTKPILCLAQSVLGGSPKPSTSKSTRGAPGSLRRSMSIRVCVESKRALRTVSKSIHLNMRDQENWDLFIFHFPLVQARCF